MMKVFVYYNEKDGRIKAISPVKSDEYQSYSITLIDAETATKFINGEWDTTKWYVASHSTEEECFLTQSEFDLRPSDMERIVQVPRATANISFGAAVIVRIFKGSKKIEVLIPPKYVKSKIQYETPEELDFFLTKRNDPSEVFTKFKVSVDELFENGKVQLNLESNAKDFSLYTNQVFMHYQLEVKNDYWSKSKRIANTRFNKIVHYDVIKNASLATHGIKVAHNINNSTLEISLLCEEEDLYIDGITHGLLYLTKLRDPTILVDTVQIHFEELIANKKIVIKLPQNIGTDFGVSSYPYADCLSFLRTLNGT